MASLTFPTLTQLKNVLDPSANTDAATKYYVDTALSSGSGVGAAGSNTQVQFNNSGTLGGSANLTFNNTTKVLTLTGNIVAGYFSGDGSSLSNITGANVTGTVANSTLATTAGTANIALSVSGSNVSGQVANALIAGTVYTADQPNITSVGTLTSLSVTNSVSAGSLNVGDVTITGNLSVTGTTVTANVTSITVKDPIIEQGGNVGGNLTANDGKDRGQILHYYTTQPVDAFMGWDNSNGEFAFGSNVASSSEVITFNKLGNVRADTFLGSFNGNVTLSNVANLYIPGGSENYVLKTDGTGNLAWESPTAHISSLTSTVDSFTGTGSQTAYTLSATPTNANFTLVMVDGIIQPRSAYTISGTTLTFSSAPYATAVIEITTFGGSVTNGSNSGTTNSHTYTLSGTTTAGAETEIFIGGATNNRIAIGNNTTATYDIQFVGRRTDVSGYNAGFNIKGVIANDAGVVTDVGSNQKTVIARSDTTYSVDARANASGNTLNIYVTGKSAHAMKWTAIVTTTEVSQ